MAVVAWGSPSKPGEYSRRLIELGIREQVRIGPAVMSWVGMAEIT
jgi:hypothetical protein